MKGILVVFILLSKLCFSQNIQNFNTNSFTPFFEYTITNHGDTIGCEFYMIVGKDTLNNINTNGEREGFWVDACYSPSDFMIDTIKILNISDMNNDLKSFSINNTKKIELLLVNNPDKINETTTYNYRDLCLFPESQKIPIKNGIFIEEYWFGYLIGKYSNNIKVGTWKFISSNKKEYCAKFIFPNELQLISKKSHNNFSFYKITAFETGWYKDNQREGVWNYSIEGFNRKTTYSKGSFLNSITQYKNGLAQKEYEIKIEEGNKLLIIYGSYPNNSDYTRWYNINHIRGIKAIGERTYFTLFPLAK